MVSLYIASTLSLNGNQELVANARVEGLVTDLHMSTLGLVVENELN